MARGQQKAPGCSNKIFGYGGSKDVFLDPRPDGSAGQGVRPPTGQARGKPRGTMLEGWQAGLIVGRRRAVNGRTWGRLAWLRRCSKVIRASSVQLSATVDSTTPQPNAVRITHLTPSKHLTTSGSYCYSADLTGGKNVRNLGAE